MTPDQGPPYKAETIYEIPNHERLVIVLGMARSGTTIFTYVLCRHRQIALYRGGAEAPLLENTCLLQRNAKRIGRVATLFLDAKYVVLKRPWQEEHAQWFRTCMPRARYIILLRNRHAIKRSWTTTGRWALGNRNEALKHPDLYYDRYYAYAQQMREILGEDQCRIVSFDELLRQPTEVFGQLADWLGVENSFDCGPIHAGQHWDFKMAEEFPRGDWILDGRSPKNG